MAKRPTVSTFRKLKSTGVKIAMITAYDAPTAALAAACGMDLLLVGDSVASTMLGYRNTMALTLEESLHHCHAVRRGAPDAFVVGDMPFMSYQANMDTALVNAARYLKEADCDAVKLEGGAECADLVHRLTGCGIPVMAHIGLLPQRVMTSGGYRIAGKTDDAAARLVRDAQILQEAGAFSVVLECTPKLVSKAISEAVDIPTIGIGGGVYCDGQVQVITDVLGLGTFIPKHAKKFAELNQIITQALTQYVKEVKSGEFPTDAQSF